MFSWLAYLPWLKQKIQGLLLDSEQNVDPVIFGLNHKALKSTIVSTSGCSANPNRQQDPTICLNPHHYQIGNYVHFRFLWSYDLNVYNWKRIWFLKMDFFDLVQLLPTDDILNTNFLDSNNRNRIYWIILAFWTFSRVIRFSLFLKELSDSLRANFYFRGQ